MPSGLPKRPAGSTKTRRTSTSTAVICGGSEDAQRGDDRDQQDDATDDGQRAAVQLRLLGRLGLAFGHEGAEHLGAGARVMLVVSDVVVGLVLSHGADLTGGCGPPALTNHPYDLPLTLRSSCRHPPLANW